ncbi:MAG: sensor histidine kinase [Phycisphaerales bacterium]
MKDRLKQKRAAGRASDAARLAAIVENSDDAILSKSLDGTILTWNAAAEKLFGYAEREAVGKSITIIVPADRLDEEEEILSRIVKGMKVDHFETVRLTKSGEEVQVSVTVSPVRDDKGKIVGASKIARNIAQQKAAEARARVLSGELDHRVKNALAVVASLAKNMLESATSLDEFGPTFEGRLLALARAHRLLSDSSWEGATVRRILDRIVAPLCRGPGQLKMSGDEAMIPARAAPALAQVLHELATNAVKYGAFSTREGRIEVRWEISSVRDMGRLHLTWTEKDGPPVREPTRTGFGTELIRGTIEHQYGGAVKIEYRPVGMRCEFDIGWSQSTVRVAGAE